MELDQLRCLSQVNGHFIDNCDQNQNFFSHTKDVYSVERPEADLCILAPCEFCNRTFVPASLNKHRRGCYKAWLKQKDRDSRMDKEKNKYQNPVSYNGEKPILTIEQMLAKRRQRRLNWRLRHEEFMRAVHAARDYADAVANGNPLPPPPPPVIEPDLRQCPHCQRRFHEKAIERHLTRCKEQSIRSNKERPSYQAMEAKRRLAVRLYYQPTSRPNSCLSMTNPPSSTSFSRPSSRQTDADFSESSDFNAGRYSSLSAIENNEAKLKIPLAVFENNGKPHGRQTPRKNYPDHRYSQNSTPVFDHRNSTPTMSENIFSGRQSNLSTFSSRNPSRQSMVMTSMETSIKGRSHKSKKDDPYDPCGNLKRSNSCVSNIRSSSVCQSERLSSGGHGRGDSTLNSRKPFSCGRSVSKESLTKKETPKQYYPMNKCNEYLSHVLKEPRMIVDNTSRHKLSSQSEKPRSPATKHRSLTSDSDRKSKQEKGHVHKTKDESLIRDHRVHVYEKNVDLLKEKPDEMQQKSMDEKKTKHRQKSLNPEIGQVQQSANVDIEKQESKHHKSVDVNRLRNEVQIRIQPKIILQTSVKMEAQQDGPKISNSQIILQNVNSSKTSLVISKEIETPPFIHKQIDSKGESRSLSQNSRIFITNCNFTKAQGDQVQMTNSKEENFSGVNRTKNMYQCKSIKSVSISDQNNTTKYRSTISLQESLVRCEDNASRVKKATEIAFFCQECGHKYSSREAKFCCSCGCKRSETPKVHQIGCLSNN